MVGRLRHGTGDAAADGLPAVAEVLDPLIYRDAVRSEPPPGRHRGAPYRRTAPPGGQKSVLGLALGGMLGLLLGLAGFSSVQGLRDNGVTTQAEVVDVTRVKSAFSYSLRYVLPDGTAVSCSTQDVLGGPAKGDTVQVLYERDYPDVNCQSADYGTGFEGPVAFTAMGGVMMATSLGLYIFRRRASG